MYIGRVKMGQNVSLVTSHCSKRKARRGLQVPQDSAPPMTSLVATFTSPESSSESAPRFNLAVPSTKSPSSNKKVFGYFWPHQLRDFVALPLPKSVPW